MSNENLELVQRCLNGDNAAWAQLVAQYTSLVYSICHLSVISDQEAEDLAQEAFIKIWTNLSRFDPQRGGLKTWIASLTRNLRVDRFRRSKEQRLTDSMDEGWNYPEPFSLAQRLVDSRQSPQDSVLSNETKAIVARKVGEISPAMRDAVKLHLFNELDKQEIARRLRIPEGTVKSRVSRGLAQLAGLLSAERAALGCA